MSSPVGILPPLKHEAKWPKALDPELENVLIKVGRVFWNLISIIIFPIGLVRLLVAALKNRALRVIVPGKIDLPPLEYFFDYVSAICSFLYNPDNFKEDCEYMGQSLLREASGHRLTLTAPDKTKLDGAFFPGKIRNKAIIYAFGNGAQWETTANRMQQLKPLNTSILMINPRGVGKSEGTRSEEGYPLDIYAAYDFLIREQKLDPSDIELVGFSMGGAIGACGAALVQQEYPDKEIHAINIKSFSDLQLEIQTFLEDKGVGAAIARIANKVLRFHLNPKEAWDTLKGKKGVFYDPSDEIITEVSSMFKAVQDHPVGTTEIVKMGANGHNTPFTQDEVTVLQEMILKHLKIDRKDTQLGRLYFSNFFSSRSADLRPRTITQVA